MAKNNTPIRVAQGSAKPLEPFWAWQARNDFGEAELSFYGYISEYSWLDDDVTPKKFKSDLARYGRNGPITIRMHSGGGELVAASAIASMLTAYPGRKTVVIDGLCASAAVIVALSADVIKIHDAAYMMVHNPGYGLLWGWMDAVTLRKYADLLDTFTSGMLDAYESRTGLDRGTLTSMLDAETWMTALEAVEKGFAHEVVRGNSPTPPSESMKNMLTNFINVPAELLNLSSRESDPQDLESDREAQRLRDEIDLYCVKEPK